MRACVYDYGTKAFSVVSDIPVPEPGEGEVRIKMTGAAINPVDTMIPEMLIRFGVVKGEAGEKYRVGVDGAGVVDKLGTGVQGLAVGTRVIYHKPTIGPNHNGGFAESSVVPANACVAVPASMDDNTAIAIPCAAWTAYQCVARKCYIKPGDSVLVYGASGGTGSFVTQFCKVQGATTIIAVCSKAKHEYALSLGATHVICYKTEDVSAKVMEITNGAGVRASIDLVGEESTKLCIGVTRCI